MSRLDRLRALRDRAFNRLICADYSDHLRKRYLRIALAYWAELGRPS